MNCACEHFSNAMVQVQWTILKYNLSLIVVLLFHSFLGLTVILQFYIPFYTFVFLILLLYKAYYNHNFILIFKNFYLHINVLQFKKVANIIKLEKPFKDTFTKIYFPPSFESVSMKEKQLGGMVWRAGKPEKYY